MNSNVLNEAVNLLNNVVLAELLKLITGKTGTVGAQLNNLCGGVSATAYVGINATPTGDYTFWINLTKCFDAAQQLPTITYEAMEGVRVAVSAAVVSGAAAVAVKNFSVRMCLVEESRILASTVFTSRQQIDAYFDSINAAFEDATALAANNLDNIAYRALVKLHAAVSNDLATRARPLPRMVTVTYRKRQPALYLAQALYQDPSRTDELIQENRPIRPLFMPTTIRALNA